MPSHSSVTEHDIDLGSAQSTMQHAYHVNPQIKVNYLFTDELAEPLVHGMPHVC